MTIQEQIQYHLNNQKICKIKRQVADGFFEYSFGYIVDSSSDFIVMQEVVDFKMDGYLVFSASTIAHIRYNNNDKYYDKIMRWEKQTDHVMNKHAIDLTNWSTIFKTIKKAGVNVIIQNEDPADYSFDIGPITKITQTAVYIQYFDPKGYLDNEPSKLRFSLITLVQFDDPYANVFSKYLRKRKLK